MATTQSTTIDVTTPLRWNESVESLQDLNARYAYTLIPFAVLLGLFSVVGIVGNILVITVFAIKNDYKQSTFKTFAVCLAITDLLSCILVIPLEIFKTQNYFIIPNIPCKIKCFLAMFSTTTAALSLLVICIERFRKVCQPLKRQIGPRLALKILLLMLFASCIIAFPTAITCGVSRENKTNIYDTTTVVYMCTADEEHRKSFLRTAYKIATLALLIIVSSALIVMYIMIVRIVVRHWGDWVRQASSVRSEQAKQIELNHKKDADQDGADRLSGEVFLPEQVDAPDEHKVASTEEGFANEIAAETPQAVTPKPRTEEPKLSRSTKSSSLTSSSSRSLKLKKVINHVSNRRRESESSFKAHTLRRRSSSARNTRAFSKTLIWVVLTMIFVVTYFVCLIMAFFANKQHTMSSRDLLLYLFFFRMYLINHVVNPIVYISMDKRFRMSTWAVVSGVWKRN